MSDQSINPPFNDSDWTEGAVAACGHDHAPGQQYPDSGSDLLTRKRLLIKAGTWGVGAATAGVLAACGADQTSTALSAADGKSKSRTLKIGYLPITDATPLLLAHANDFYGDHGVEVPKPTLLRGWPALAEAFQSGAVDVVHILMPLAIQMRYQRRFPAKVIAWNHTNGSGLTVRPDVNDVEDLIGQTVAIPGWFSIHNIALQVLFRKAGIKSLKSGKASKADRSVKLVPMAPPDMPPALAQGSIAGYIVADPFNAAAEVKGIGKILRFTGDIWRDHACCVVAVREKLLDERPDVARAFMGALVRAQHSARDNPEAAGKVLTSKGYLPQPEPVVQWALTHGADPEYAKSGAIQHPQWKERRIDFQGFPFPTYTEEVVRLLRQTVIDGDTRFLRGLDGAKVHSELVDDKLVRAAISTNGGPKAFDLPESLRRKEQIKP